MNALVKRLAVPIACCLFSLTAQAGGTAPVVYNKTIIHILPKPGSPLIAQTNDKKEDKDNKGDKDKKDDQNKKADTPPQPRTAKTFSVDVRPPAFLLQEGFFAQQPFADKGGMMIIIDPPAETILRPANLFAKVDVLLVRKDGLITKIAPNLKLSTLEEPIDSDGPIHAFLFLKADTARLSDIRPGDHVENALFKPHPIVLDESTPPEPAASAATGVATAPPK